MRALIVTSTAGAKRLRRQKTPEFVDIRAVRGGDAISAKAILAHVRRVNSGKLILVEGGPRLLGDFFADGLLDEQFLTLAPQVAGRERGDRRLGLVMGRHFAPRSPLWGRLVDLRRGASHLFLRYAFTD
jgi:riboflavin biosynthesis pyrimidine reductase